MYQKFWISLLRRQDTVFRQILSPGWDRISCCRRARYLNYWVLPIDLLDIVSEKDDISLVFTEV